LSAAAHSSSTEGEENVEKEENGCGIKAVDPLEHFSDMVHLRAGPMFH
jgi:hypothetical protein